MYICRGGVSEWGGGGGVMECPESKGICIFCFCSISACLLFIMSVENYNAFATLLFLNLNYIF